MVAQNGQSTWKSRIESPEDAHRHFCQRPNIDSVCQSLNVENKILTIRLFEEFTSLPSIALQFWEYSCQDAEFEKAAPPEAARRVSYAEKLLYAEKALHLVLPAALDYSLEQL